jgi:hypothetical protein
LVELANGELASTNRMLLAKVFGQFTSEKDLVEGLWVLRDDGSGVPYEFVRPMENVFLERRHQGSSRNAYTLSPLGVQRHSKTAF